MGMILKAVTVLVGLAVSSACGAGPAEPEAEATVASTTTATHTARTTVSSTPDTPTPTVSRKSVTETEKVPFSTRTVRDPGLDQGRREVRTRGVPGVRTKVYEVTLVDGEPSGRKLVESRITRKPVAKVVAIGTRKPPEPEPEPKRGSGCDENYSGCVPIASDVDCAGGSGNGPAYVTGPVRVIGTDIYDLDRDGDGLACED